MSREPDAERPKERGPRELPETADGARRHGPRSRGPSLNPAICGKPRVSSPTPPQGDGNNGRGADNPQERSRGRARARIEGNPQRLDAGASRTTVPGKGLKSLVQGKRPLQTGRDAPGSVKLFGVDPDLTTRDTQGKVRSSQRCENALRKRRVA